LLISFDKGGLAQMLRIIYYYPHFNLSVRIESSICGIKKAA
jgi:hypothetical protein